MIVNVKNLFVTLNQLDNIAHTPDSKRLAAFTVFNEPIVIKNNRDENEYGVSDFISCLFNLSSFQVIIRNLEVQEKGISC